MSVQVEALRQFIGKPARDKYNRYIGYIVGITLDSAGNLNSVGIDHGGSLEEYTSAQIVIDNDKLIFIPSWMIMTGNFSKENNLVHRRFQALDELKRDSEIPSHVYEDLHREYKDALTTLEESQLTLNETLSKKIEGLDKHTKHLERFLGCLKVQHKTGEMGDDTFKLASEYLISELDNTANEKKDIQNFLDGLVVPPKVEMSITEMNNSPSPETEIKETEPQKSEGTDEPITVHLQMEK